MKAYLYEIIQKSRIQMRPDSKRVGPIGQSERVDPLGESFQPAEV